MHKQEPNPSDNPSQIADEARKSAQQVVGSFRRLALIVLASIVVMFCVAGGVVFGLYKRATAPVPEYEAALSIDPEVVENDRRRFESQLSALVSDSQSLEEWKTCVTAAEINAWLALRLERDFPGFQKAGLQAPRVVLRESEVLIAATSTSARVKGIVSLTLRPMVTETDELALNITSAKIGQLSLPIESIMGQLRQSPLAEIGPVRLAQSGEGAAVIIDLDRIETGSKRGLQITGVDVRPDELLLRGESPPTNL